MQPQFFVPFATDKWINEIPGDSLCASSHLGVWHCTHPEDAVSRSAIGFRIPAAKVRQLIDEGPMACGTLPAGSLLADRPGATHASFVCTSRLGLAKSAQAVFSFSGDNSNSS